MTLSGILIFLGPGSVTQGVFSLVVCFASIQIYSYYEPMRSDADNNLMETSQIQLLLVRTAAGGGFAGGRVGEGTRLRARAQPSIHA